MRKMPDRLKDTWPEGHPRSRFNKDGSRKDNKPEQVKRVVSGDVDLWKSEVKKTYPEEAAKLRFVSKDNGKHISAEIPGKDRSYGVYVISKNRGEILGEMIKGDATMELLNELYNLLEKDITKDSIIEIEEESFEIKEDLEDQTVFKKLEKLEDEVSKLEIVRKGGAFSVSIITGIRVYHIRNKYFAAWHPEKRRGIVDPDFKGKPQELIDHLKDIE